MIRSTYSEFIVAIAVVVVVCVGGAACGFGNDIDPQVTASLNRYCVKCHGTTKPKGDFQIGQLKVSANQADA